MDSHWELTIAPSPPMATYNDLTLSSHPEGSDVYITLSSLNTSRDVPGIPSQYASAYASGRAVYVTGIPFGHTCQDVAELFSHVAVVEACPALVSLESMNTFRWVIYEEAEGATSAIRLLNGDVVEGNEVRIVMSLPPNKVFTVVKHSKTATTGGDDEEEEENQDEVTPKVSQQPFHAHQTLRPVSTASRDHAINDGFVHAVDETPQKFSSGPTARAVLMTSNACRQSFENGMSSLTSPATESHPTLLQIPEPALTPGKASTHKSQSSDHNIGSRASWANIAGRNRLAPSAIINVQSRNRVGLRPDSRDPGLDVIRRVNTNTETLQEQRRVVLLLNLPNNIQLRDVSDAVREGSLVKIVFGINEEDKSRFAGIIFQRSPDAWRFYEVMQKEREQSRPNRFRFIVDSCIGEPFPMNDDIRAMGYPQYATRRLTIVKARFFFMFKEEHLRRFCQRLVPAENIQLIWLYNGGNATVVFSDIASAIKVKKELDRKAAAAGQPGGGEPQIWLGLTTTFSKDPSLSPLDDLKTALYD